VGRIWEKTSTSAFSTVGADTDPEEILGLIGEIVS